MLVMACIMLPIVLGAQEVVTIYDIQYTTDPNGTSPMVGDTVITYGIVTGYFGNGFFMEERPGGPWHGIYVYVGYNGASVQIGDSVMVEGVVSEYHNLTEISTNYYGEVTVLGSGYALDTTEITVAQMNDEQYEGLLAIIRNVYFVESGTFEGNHQYHIVSEDGADTGIVYVKSSSGVVGNPIPTGLTNVVGNMSQYDEHYEILPRDVSDVAVEESGNAPVLPGINIDKNILRAGEPIRLTLNNIGNCDITLYNVAGVAMKKLHSSSEGNIFISTDDLPRGVYLLTVESHTIKLVNRVVLH